MQGRAFCYPQEAYRPHTAEQGQQQAASVARLSQPPAGEPAAPQQHAPSAESSQEVHRQLICISSQYNQSIFRRGVAFRDAPLSFLSSGKT